MKKGFFYNYKLIFTIVIIFIIIFSCTITKPSDNSENETLSVQNRALSPDDYSINYTISDDWGSGFVVNVAITNNSGSAFNGWTLTWTFPGDQTITNAWNADVTQSGNAVTVKNVDWNSTIPAGGSVSFGFQGTYSSSNAEPANFVLDSTTASSSSSSVVSSSSSLSSSSVVSSSSSSSSSVSSTLEVELESLSGQGTFSPFVVQSNSSASGGQYIVWPNDGNNQILSTPSDSASGQVEIGFTLSQTSSVQFQITCDMANGNDDSFYYKLDSNSWNTQNNTSTSGWETLSPSTFNSLSAGSHTLKILRREDGAKLDKVILTASAGSISGSSTSSSSSSSIVSSSSSSSSIGDISTPNGYAQGTTGGGNASPITVSSALAFISAVSGDSAKVIIVNGSLNLAGSVTIGSNTTIKGADSSAGLYGGTIKIQGTNYIIQNLTFGPSEGDVMEISGATKVFVHKCTFHDSTDELCSIVRAADYVTVSWCRFYFNNPDDHSYAHLIGNSDSATGDRGKLHVTLHHNWYDNGVKGRQPRVRFGYVHIYNCYWGSNNADYCIGVGYECHIRVENSYFDNVDDPWADYGGTSNGFIGWSNLKFEGCFQPTFMSNTYPVFSPPYSFNLDPVDNVESIVKAGAGNR